MNIELFFIPLAHMDEGLSRRAMALLSDDERVKVERYRAPKAQMNGLLVRAALRCVLSKKANLTPTDWCFEYGARGKPSLTTKLRR